RKGSRAARRRFILSIQNCATSTYSDFLQAASTSLRSRRMDNSSSTIGTKFICATAISTGTECLPACRTYWTRANATASLSPASWAMPNGLQATGRGVDDFLEYECRLNNIIPQYKDAVICLYNLTKCGGN